MIIIDLSGIMMAAAFVNMKNVGDLDEGMVRHMILNSIRMYKTKYSATHGEVVIACDLPSETWRKKVFPYYKARRRANQQQPGAIDWTKLFDILGTVREEIKECMPYRVVGVPGAEADDVIAVLVQENSLELINNGNRILIISGDGDFIQLHKYPNVEQYNPMKKQKVSHNDPYGYLREHILRGDVGDGIPNFLSGDSCLAVGERQKAITAKRLQEAGSDPESTLTGNSLRNFKRNQRLIDFTFIPDDIRSAILDEYAAQAGKDKSKILSYFAKKRLVNLMDYINDF